MAHVIPGWRRGRRGLTAVSLLLVLGVLLGGCRPSGERRLVSLREGEFSGGEVAGQLLYVETRGVRQSALFVHDLDRDERQRLTLPPGYANSPAWSPDGRHVAFSLTGADGFSHLWVVPVAGGRARQITDGEVVDDHPRWSPDGETLVFTSIRDGDYDWRLFTVAVGDPEPPRPVGSTDGHSVFPDWSPDGRHLVYANRGEGNYRLRLHDLESGSDRRITDGPGEDLYPRFSPDGREVLFSSTRVDDVWQIQRLDLATDEVEHVVGSDSMDEFPVYSPDMQHVAFSAGHLALYRADGEAFPDGKLRWSITRNLAWTPDWRG